MDIPYATRKELDKLSKEVFGVSSRWQKMVKGSPELITKTVEETIPSDGDAPPTTKQVQVPSLTPEGAKQYRVKSMSLEEVKAFLLILKSQRDEQLAKMQEQKRQQELAKQVQDQAAGSASS